MSADDLREVHVGWGKHPSLPDTYRVYAECEDEETDLILIGPRSAFHEIYLLAEPDIADSEAYRELVKDHRARCESCQKWATQ